MLRRRPHPRRRGHHRWRSSRPRGVGRCRHARPDGRRDRRRRGARRQKPLDAPEPERRRHGQAAGPREGRAARRGDGAGRPALRQVVACRAGRRPRRARHGRGRGRPRGLRPVDRLCSRSRGVGPRREGQPPGTSPRPHLRPDRGGRRGRAGRQPVRAVRPRAGDSGRSGRGSRLRARPHRRAAGDGGPRHRPPTGCGASRRGSSRAAGCDSTRPTKRRRRSRRSPLGRRTCGPS